MNCYFCQAKFYEELKNTCQNCNVTYVVMNIGYEETIMYCWYQITYNNKQYQVEWWLRDPPYFFDIYSLNDMGFVGDIILELDNHANITPQNIVSKMPTLLTFS